MTEAKQILIIEDELLVALDLQERLKQHGFDVVGVADNFQDALTLFKEFLPDLVLIDITIKDDKTGIDIAKAMNELHLTPFIYISAHSDVLNVNKAKNTNPSGYLVKPFTTRSLLVAIELALHNFSKLHDSRPDVVVELDEHFYVKGNHVFIKDNYRFVKVFLNDIYFLSAEGNYVKIFTENKTFLLRITLTKAMEVLDKNYFIRIHRSYCINTNQIESFTENEVVIKGRPLTIGRNFKDDFMRALRLS
jgi:DNA-binding LytR/AlgR family response regulator